MLGFVRKENIYSAQGIKLFLKKADYDSLGILNCLVFSVAGCSLAEVPDLKPRAAA